MLLEGTYISMSADGTYKLGHWFTHTQNEDCVHQGQQIDVPAPEDTLESRPAKTGARCATDPCHSLLRNHNLSFREPPRSSVLRQIGDRIYPSKSNRHRDDAVHDEQPLPATNSVGAFEPFVYRCLQIPAEHASRSTGCKLDDVSVIHFSGWGQCNSQRCSSAFPIR